MGILEAELGHMKQKVIRLNEIAEQFMQTPEVVESAFTAATKGSHRAINDLNLNIMKRVDDMFVEKTSSKATLTEMFGLNRVFGRQNVGQAHTKEAEVQAN